MSKLATYYTGQDIALKIDLKTIPFADALDVIVDVFNNSTLVKTLKKSETINGKKLIAVAEKPTQCLVRVFVDEVATMQKGYVRTAITVVMEAEGFPEGRHDKYFGTIAQFETL